MELGKLGVWTTYRAIGEANAGEAARLVEQLGFGTFWLRGSPRLPTVRPLLAPTERRTGGTGIVNVWQYEPATLAAEHAALITDFPDRFLLGIGIGHPEATTEYERPLTTMRIFLDGLDAASTPVPRDERCLAALGPRMLALCAERSRGALPYFVPLAHTRLARERLGPDALLATEVACVLDDDAERARATARTYASLYLKLRNYTANLRRFGFTDADIEDGGSDRLFEAGAHHVRVQPLGQSGVPGDQWAALAAALTA